MAEIKVEPKRGGLGWLWAIIILVLVAAVLWYVFNGRTAPATVTPADSARTSMIERVPSASPSLVAWSATNG
jgi:hypothetical protein